MMLFNFSLNLLGKSVKERGRGIELIVLFDFYMFECVWCGQAHGALPVRLATLNGIY